MSLFSGHKRAYPGQSADQVIPPRPEQRAGTAAVTNETALRHSAVWACLRLRANLVSTMPVDVFRRVGGIQVEVPKPPVLVTPGGAKVRMIEWLYSSQMDLDRAGNCFGLITAVDGYGLPARIELVPLCEVTVRVRKGVLKYVIAGKEYDPSQVWHEKQYTIPGLPVGLSPVAYAALSIGEYLSIQEFALAWFGNNTMPAAHLKNTGRTITPDFADETKRRFKSSIANNDLFVTGSDWEYKVIQAEAAGAEWIEAKRFGISDVARFFDTPGDLIDAAVSGSSLTYANISQRNLQFLIMNLGPAVIRREDALTSLTPQPRFVKLNTDALLRMDPQTRAATVAVQVNSRVLAPSEARELEDRPPFTEDQLAEFDRLFGTKTPAPGMGGGTAPTGAMT